MKQSFVNVKIIVMFMLLAVIGFAADEGKENKEKKDTTKVVRVETKKVCMVNDKIFEKDQIPVEVEGKTYYGCCEMCKKTLQEKAEFRSSIDPVSGKKVDKSVAVIGANSEGITFYFENEDNLKAYNEKH